MRLRSLHLFAGGGGGLLSDIILGHQPVCAVEIDGYCQQVLAARQKDGSLPWFPIFDDVKQFNGKEWRGLVDIIAGGFPCTDLSAAGRGAGITGEQSGLWVEMARIIGEVRPRFAFVENSPVLTSRGLGTVLGDLAAMGYDARWGVLGAADVGAPHLRKRIWIVAHAHGEHLRELSGWERRERRTTEQPLQDVADPERNGLQGNEYAEQREREAGLRRRSTDPLWWTTEPDVGRVAHGVAARVDRLKALGNGQVPQCAAEAWRILTK